MKLLTGLFRAARKRTLTTDNDMGMFREKLTELVEKKAELPDEEVAKRVDELKEMTVDLPESEDKSKEFGNGVSVMASLQLYQKHPPMHPL